MGTPARHASADGAPSAARIWIAAARPRTLGAAVAPVALATALAWADGVFHAPSALAALLGALLIQIGSNLANDYFDWRHGADSAGRLGPPRVTQQGWVAPRRVAAAAAACLGLSMVLGVYLVVRGGWPIATVGLLSVLGAVAYTGGPYPLGYHGLGDIAAWAFFGPVAVGGTYYVQAQQLSASCLWPSIGVGSLVAAILVVNNIRDRHTDEVAGKRTLAVRLGVHASRAEYVALLLLAYLAVIVAWLSQEGSLMRLIPLVSLPLAAYEGRRVLLRDGAALNPSLGGTARLALVYALLWSWGVVW